MVQPDKTWLFVPAKEKYIANITKINADVIILDLEDSLSESQKEEGLRLTVEVLKEYGTDRTIYVRLNTGERMEEELSTLNRCSATGYMIPKFEDTYILEKYENWWQKKEIIPLIESTRGVINLEHIAGNPKLKKLAFGGEDFCRELGFGAGEEATIYARSKLVLYASYYHKYSLDTISLEIHDIDKFMDKYRITKRMGFSGKLLIHPNQIEAVRSYHKSINEKHLRNIVEIYKKSKEGIIQIDGQWYEKPHIEIIEAYLENFGGHRCGD